MPRGDPNVGTNKKSGNTELRREIELLVAKATEIKFNLPTPEENVALGRLFKGYARYFSDISSKFIYYEKRKGNPYYIFINSADGPKTAAKGIVDAAKKVAKLFERYGKRPQNYSQVECRIAIDYLLAELGNLKFYC